MVTKYGKRERSPKLINMTQEEYYKAPPQDVFDEIKDAAIRIWRTYDDTYGYATEKINQIKDLKNVQDNAWYIVAMFDPSNQTDLLLRVSPKTAEMIRDARGY